MIRRMGRCLLASLLIAVVLTGVMPARTVLAAPTLQASLTSESGGYSSDSVYGTDYRAAETFISPGTFEITSVEPRTYRVGSPGDLTVSIYAVDVEHKPTGGVLSSGNVTANGFTTADTGAYNSVPVSSYNIQEGTEYAIVLTAATGDIDNKVGWYKTQFDVDSNYYSWRMSNGSTWVVNTGDHHFKVYGETLYPAVATIGDVSAITGTSATLNATLTSLGDNANVNVSFDYGYTTDYSGIVPSYDYSTTPVNYSSVPQSIAQGIAGLLPGYKLYYRIVLDGDVVDYTGTGNSFWTSGPPSTVAFDNYVNLQGAVTHVFQRKGFYAAGRYWLMYLKSQAVSPAGGFYYRSSTDGLVWSDPYLFIEAENGSSWPNYSILGWNEADELNVYFDGTYLHAAYVWNRNIPEATEPGAVSNNVYYRRGVPNSDGTIAWTSDWVVALARNNTTVKGYASITTDTNGYPYIDYWESEGINTTEGSNYATPTGILARRVIKSSTNDGTFTMAGGYPVTLKSEIGNRGTGVLLQLTGGKVYWVGIGEAQNPDAVGKLYDGASWGSEETISNTDAWGMYRFSAVSRGDTVHVVFLDKAKTTIYYTKRLDTGWTTPVAVVTGITDVTHSVAPALSINQATGDLYLFWNNNTDNKIYYKVYTVSTASWGSAVVLADESWAQLARTELSTHLGSFQNIYNGRLGVYYVQAYNGWTYTPNASYMDLRFTYLEITAGPAVQTNDAANIEQTTATLQGYLINNGGQSTQVRFEWGTSIAYGNATTWQSKTTGDPFSDNLAGLTANTTYYFRAVAKWADETTSYGTGKSFITSSAGLPTITTGTAVSVTSSGATLQGTLTSLGNYSPVYVYFEYGLTAGYGTTTAEQTRTTTGGYNQAISGLASNTLYHFRAVVRYNGSYVYGSDNTFTTSALGAPTVTTIAAVNIAPTSATLQGTLDSLGGYSPVYVYFQYGLTAGYGTDTVEQTRTEAGGVSQAITGLSASTLYHFRVVVRYGVSSYAYGADDTFTTSASPPVTMTISEASVFTGYLETGDWLITLAYENIYPPYYPSEYPASYFNFQLISGGGVIAQSNTRMWGYRPGSIYLSADEASLLQWGGSYTVRLIGNFAGTPYVDYVLTASDWSGAELLLLDAWVVTLAGNIAEFDGVAMTTFVAGVGEQLNSRGQTIFAIGIPHLATVRPGLFEMAVRSPAPEDDEFSVTETDMATELGTDATEWLDDARVFVGVEDSPTMGGIIFLVIAVVVLGASAVAGFFYFGVAACYIGLIIATVTGVTGWAILGVVTFVIAVVWVFAHFSQK